MIAPQYGLWSGLPPLTDNPAAPKKGPPPAETRQRLQALRAEFAKRAGKK